MATAAGAVAAEAPTVTTGNVGQLSSDAANLYGSVSTGGLGTEFSFEYGTTPAYGLQAPAQPGELEASGAGTEVSVHLTGLAPDTTYHYRLVANNAEGPAEGADRTFTTYAVGGPLVLPDNRAWELVSPVENGNNDVAYFNFVESRGVAGEDEDGVAYEAMNGLPGSESGLLVLGYTSQRGADGWTTFASSPPGVNKYGIADGEPTLYSRDLGEVLTRSKEPLTPDSPVGQTNLYVRTNSPVSYKLVTEYPFEEPEEFFYVGVGSSRNFKRVFFTSTEPLTPDSPALSSTKQLYEWSEEGGLVNVGILPGETTPNPAEVAVPNFATNAVSEDGSSVVFDTSSGGHEGVFQRLDGNTIEVSAPETGVVDPHGEFNAQFVGASADGTLIYFKSGQQLTADANTGPAGGSENLYRYDTETGGLTDLSVTAGGGEGPAVKNAVVSEDGDNVYFVATAEVAGEGTAGQPNLYRWNEASGTTLVATLASGDPLANTFEAPGAATSADGAALAFTSRAGLAGNLADAGVLEIYHWSAADGVACASCGNAPDPTGARILPPTVLGGAGGHPISANGEEVFFSTADALVPQDTNGKVDTYEWQDGKVSLLSSGTGESDSTFMDASPSGKDVFFVTRDRLVGADIDENTHVYDAREGGGFPEGAEAAAPCEAEACRPPLEAAPAAAQLGSSSFDGPSNPKPKHKRKPTKKKAKKAKPKKAKPKPKQHSKSKQKKSKQKSDKRHSAGKRG